MATTVNIPRDTTMQRIAEALELLWEAREEANDGVVSYKKKQTATAAEQKTVNSFCFFCAVQTDKNHRRSKNHQCGYNNPLCLS